MSKIRMLIFLWAVFVIFIEGLSLAQEAEIFITAEHLERLPELKIVIAKGNVEIVYQDVRLWADEVHMNTETKDVTATGNVIIWELRKDEITGGHYMNGYMKCDKLEFNMDTKKGVAYRARGYLDPYYYFEGERVLKVDEDTYSIKNGSITTCSSDCSSNPDWKLKGMQVVIKTESYAKVFGVSGWIKSIPVIFSPYIEAPAKAERKSGFLVPTIGYKTRGNVFVKVPVYFVLSRSSDLTLLFTPYSKGALGFGGEYRKVFSDTEKLRLKGDYIAESDGSRWNLSGRFNKEIGIDTEVKGSVDYKNISYRRYYTESFEEYSEIYSDSVVELTRRSHYTSINALLRYQRDNSLGISQSVSKLPELDFTLYPVRIGLIRDLFASFSGQFLRYHEKREESGIDKTLTRFDISPSLYFPFAINSFITLLPSYSLRYTHWSRSYKEGEFYTDSTERVVYQIDLSTRGPILVKPIDLPLVGRLLHFVIPEVRYTYVPYVAVDFPLFDERDYIKPLNKVTYSVYNRFLLRDAGGTREVARLIFEQSYDVRKAIKGIKHRLSDVYVIFDAYPYAFSVNTRLYFDPYRGDFVRSAYSVGYLGKVYGGTDGTLRISYYEDRVANSRYIEYLGGLSNPPFDVNLTIRRDIYNDYWVEKGVYIGYVKNCWAVRLGYRVLDTTKIGGRSDKTLYLIVVFKGLGTLGSIDESQRLWLENIKRRWNVPIQ